MTHLRMPAPQALDLVDADEVGERIAETELELSALEREAADAVAACERAESSASTVNIDATSTTWTIVRLQRFCDDLRAEAQRDATTMIEVARYHAQIRIEEARAIAAGGDRVRPPLVLEPLPRAEPVVSEPAVAAPVVPEPTPISVIEAAPVAAWYPDPLGRHDARYWDGSAWTDRVADHGVEGGDPMVVPEPEPVPVVTAAVVVEAPPAVVAPAVVPVVEPPPAAEAAEAAEPAKAPKVKKPRKRGLRGLPLSAVLEILAVLLLLAFIVMRLS